LTKGNPIFITGRLHQQKWQAQDGSNRTKMEVIVGQFRFIGGASGNNAPTVNETGVRSETQRPENKRPETQRPETQKPDDDVFK